MAYRGIVYGIWLSIMAMAINASAEHFKFPSEKDTLYCGASYSLKWKDVNKAIPRITLEITSAGGTMKKIGENIENKGEYSWKISRNDIPAGEYRFSIRNMADAAIMVSEEKVTIAEPSVTIIKPAAGDELIAANPVSVKWRVSGDAGKPWRIELYKKTKPALILAKSTNSGGSFSWTVGESDKVVSGFGYRIRITSLSDTVLSCLSGEFRIINNAAVSRLENILLDWRPTEYKAPAAVIRHSLASLSLHCLPFIDKRTMDTAIIGKNVEHTKEKTVTTCESVAQWCRQHFSEMLHTAGAQLSDDSSAISIRATIDRFFVTEGNTYEGVACMTFQVMDGAGGRLYDKTIENKASNWGRSFKVQNYQETLSNVLVSVYKTLLEDENFLRAIKGAKTD